MITWIGLCAGKGWRYLDKHKGSILAFFLAFAPRFALLCLHMKFPSRILDDLPPSYWHAATGILEEGALSIQGRTSTYVEPLYPLFLAALRFLGGNSIEVVLFAQVLLTSFTNVFFYQLAFSLTGNIRVAGFAATIRAFYPYLIRRALKISVSPLLSFLLLASLYFLTKIPKTRYAILAGIGFGLIVITRSMMLPYAVAVCLFFIFKRQCRNAVLFAFSAMVCIIPMMSYNYKTSGSLLPTRSGLNLFISNCEFTDRIYPRYHPDILLSYAYGLAKKELGEDAFKNQKYLDDFFKRKAIEFMWHEPLTFLKLKIQNAALFFMPWTLPFYSLPSASLEISDGVFHLQHNSLDQPWRMPAFIIIHAFSYGGILIAGFAGFFSRRRFLTFVEFCMIMLAGYFILVYSLYWMSTRFQHQLLFIFIFYAAVWLDLKIPPRSLHNGLPDSSPKMPQDIHKLRSL